MNLATNRVRKHRKKLRNAGLRPVQIWVPNTKEQGFAEKCRKQSLSLYKDPSEEQVLDWIEAVADTDGWQE